MMDLESVGPLCSAGVQGGNFSNHSQHQRETSVDAVMFLLLGHAMQQHDVVCLVTRTLTWQLLLQSLSPMYL